MTVDLVAVDNVREVDARESTGARTGQSSRRAGGR
jgi:hypothetical protein